MEKEIEKIVDKMISIGSDKKHTFLEVFDSLLEIKDYRLDILASIPEILALRGYDIANKNYFELIKY